MVEAIYPHKAHINRVKPAKNMDNLVKNNNVLIRKERKSKFQKLFICLKYSIHEILLYIACNICYFKHFFLDNVGNLSKEEPFRLTLSTMLIHH